MPTLSPGKYTTIEYLEQCRVDNYGSPTGKEYIAEELESLLLEKYQRKADLNLKVWTSDKPSATHDDGLLDYIIEKEEPMKVKFTTEETINEPTIKEAIDADKVRDIVDQAHTKSKAELIELMSDYFERSLKYAENIKRQTTIEMRQIADSIKQTKSICMHVSVNGSEKRKLSKPASKFLPDLIMHANLGIKTLMVGPSQCGKTTAAVQLAESKGLPFYRVSMSEMPSKGELWGRKDPATGEIVKGLLHQAAENGGVILFDELDATDAGTGVSLAQFFDDDTHVYNPMLNCLIAKHENLIILAAANTFGRGADMVYVGRNRLDGSTIKRFVPVAFDYDQDIEKQVCPDDELLKIFWSARDKLREKAAKEFVTTKDLIHAFKLKSAGLEHQAIVDRLTLGWPKELVKHTFDVSATSEPVVLV